MTAIPDHYAALGIDPTADPEVIAAAYRALAKKFHPDTGATTGTASPERFEQVQRAYEVLRTPESRRQYDLELLAQAERDLEEHLARKRRALPGTVGVPPGTAKPDLGAIRPDPSGAAERRGKPAPAGTSGERRSIAPYLIPVVLLLALLGGAAWLFLPKPLQAPAAAVAEQAAPAPQKAETAAAKPVFNSASEEADAAAVDTPETPAQKADAEPVQEPTAVPTSAEPEGEAQKPVFGSSVPEDPAAEAEAAPGPAMVPPAPTPKPRPAQQKPASTEPPTPPRRQVETSSAFKLVIFERRRRGRVITQQADMLFASRSSCVEFGVQAVLRRMEARNMNPRRQRIWYECQPAS